MSDHETLLAALKQALDKDPRNGTVWLHYADLLIEAKRPADAIAALRNTLELGHEPASVLARLLPLLRANGEAAEALIRAEKFLAAQEDAGVRLELARVLAARGDLDGAREHYDRVVAEDASRRDEELEGLLAGSGASGSRAGEESEANDSEPAAPAAPEEPPSPSEEDDVHLAEVDPSDDEDDDVEQWAEQIDWGDLAVTFADVAGLDDVKKQIRLRIIAPFQQKEIFEAFGRRAGGGILLYGPPGCGKTFIAKATAGECRARFVSVGLHDVLDRYWGESEKIIHALFEEARSRAPTVLFFDEFDAVGTTRGRGESHFTKTLVDQLLQEMDGVGGQNENVLVFAATNVPWNVDAAFRRPGRFDRLLFVPPPDRPAREQILRRQSDKLPLKESLPIEKIAAQTELMTGADLVALIERASERALERSLETGDVHPVTPADFERELKKTSSSASEWLATAKNYARYSNEGGRYDELADFLRKVKRF